MKLVRADEHLEALNNAVEAFLAIRPYEVLTEKDIPARTYRAKLIHRHSPPGQLLMILGDVLYNLRSALDHIAWSLAGQRADSRTEFPIFIDRQRFSASDRNGIPSWGSGLSKMHDMPTCAQRLIEQMQPYHGLNGLPEMEPLWLLQRLNIEDKHHTLNLVAGGVDIRLEVLTHPDTHPVAGLTGRTGWLPLPDRAEIYHFPLPRDHSQMQDHSRMSFDVAFDPEGPARGIPLREGLGDMRETVAWALQSLRPFIP